MIRTFLLLSLSTSLALAGPVVSEEALCNVCREAVQDVEAAVRDDRMHARLVGRLETVCELVGPERREECDSVLNGLSREVLSHLMEDMNPIDLCMAMTACPARTENYTPKKPTLVQPRDNDNLTCELCEIIVQAIDDTIRNKTSPAAANATAYKICEALPVQLRETCITFAPLITDMIIDGVDPVGACTNMGVCLDDVKISLRNAEPEKLSDTPTCELCELLVNTVDQYLKENKTEAAINATIYKLCNELPAGTSKNMCLQYAPLIVTALSKGVDPKQACTFLGLCTSKGEQIPVFKKLSDTPTCELCELLVATVDQYLKENKTEAAINATIYKLCNELPTGTLKYMCLQIPPPIVAALSKGVDPKQACTFLELCTSKGEQIPVPKIKVKKLSDTPTCELCELLVNTVDQYLKENKTEAAINATIYKLCNELPAGTPKDVCLQYAPQIIAALSKGVDPKQACTFLGLCTSKGEQIPVPKIKRASDTVVCELCELLVQAVDQYLKENRTEAAINATIYKLCNDLPAGISRNLCLENAPKVVAVLAQGVDPKQACTELGLCTSTGVEVPVPEIKRVSDTVTCDLCKLLVQTVDQYLKENRTEAAVNATIYKLCNDLPAGTLQNECLLYAPQLVSMLENGVDPQKACAAIGLCTSTDVQISLPEVKRVSDTELCELCELLVNTVDQYLKENKTEAAINATIYKLCNDLPAGTLQNTCLQYAPNVVSILEKGVDPKQACTAIGLCNSAEAANLATLSNALLNPRAVVPESGDDRWCTICKDHMEIIDQDLYVAEPILLHILDDICHRLPPPTDKACLNAADTNFPKIWENLLNGTASADNVCRLLTLCTK